MLLCGESGAGKTSLAYACAKRDWCYVSDNESWLLRDDGRAGRAGQSPSYPFSRLRAGAVSGTAGAPAFSVCQREDVSGAGDDGRPEFSTAYPAEYLSPGISRSRADEPGSATVSKEEAFQKLFSGVPTYSLPVREQHEASLRRLVTAETVQHLLLQAWRRASIFWAIWWANVMRRIEWLRETQGSALCSGGPRRPAL